LISGTELALGPIAGAVVGGLEVVEQFGDGGFGDFWSLSKFGSFGDDAPNAAGLAVATGVAEGVLGVAFDGIIPVTNVSSSTRSEAEVHGDKGEVGGEDEVELILLGEVVGLFVPLVEFDAVGGLVTDLDKAALHFLGPKVVGDEVLSADAGVGLHAFGAGMLSGVVGVGGVEGRGEDGVGGHVVSIRVEGYAPGVGVGVGTEGGELSSGGMVEEPGRVFGADGAVGGLSLGVVENGFAEEEVASGRPGKVVEGVVGIFTAEARENDLAVVHFTVAIGIGEVGEMGLFRAEDAAVAIENEGERDVEVIGPGGTFVCFAVLVGVFEDDDFVARLLAGVDVWVGDGGGDPEAAVLVPAHLNGAGHFGEVFFGGEAVDFEARVDFEGLQFVGGGEEFVGSAREEDVVKLGEIGVVGFGELTGGDGFVNGLVAIGNHEVEVPHGGEEVEVAIGFVATAGVVEGVEGAIAVVELGGLIDDELAEVFVDGGWVFVEEGFEGDVCETLVALEVVLVAVDGPLSALADVDFSFGSIEDIGKADGMIFRTFGKGPGVIGEVFVISISGVDSGDVFTGCR